MRVLAPHVTIPVPVTPPRPLEESQSLASPLNAPVALARVSVPEVLSRTAHSPPVQEAGKVCPVRVAVWLTTLRRLSDVPAVVWKVLDQVTLSNVVSVTPEPIWTPLLSTERMSHSAILTSRRVA